ncbi:hypothetical protein GCM10011502_02040 [Oceanisphaera marina]|uniref:Uncharacterized protein n=1 Tax=Oceanisphaera marina TaxID=2017550 RepID=A0ABQ1IAY2_9GAMM|nr:hypothetical protein GCM10011502_02040 [Oceanisphaera marina]
MHGLLDETVYHAGNAQHAPAASGLGDVYLAHRLRMITAVQQLLFDVWPVGLQMAFQLIGTHPIYPRCTLVTAHTLIGSPHVRLFGYR